jgi:hypothetical protein
MFSRESRVAAGSWHGPLLVAIYLFSRVDLLPNLRSPIVGWRPADLASIALNFSRNGMNLLHPQVLWGGRGPGYVEMEFPLVPFVTGMLYRLFGVHEWLNLVIPIPVGLALVGVTYLLAHRLAGRTAALIAGATVAVSPTLVMLTTTGLWPDPPMLLCSTLGLYLLVRWTEEGRLRDLAFGACSISLAVLLKPTALHVGLPVFVLLWHRFGRSFWRAPAFWGLGAVALLPSILWYWHAYQLGVHYGNTFGILGAGYSKLGNLDLLAQPRFHLQVLYRTAAYHLTPFAALAGAAGAWIIARGPRESSATFQRSGPLLLSWLTATVVCLLVSAGGAQDAHYQYCLPVLPVGAVLAGIGIDALLRAARLEPSRPLSLGTRLARLPLAGGGLRRFPALAGVTLAVLFTLNAALATRRFRFYDRIAENIVWEQKKVAGTRVKSLTPTGSLLVVADAAMDAHTPETSMTPPDVFYFSDRRGWYLSLAWLDDEQLEHLRAQGAEYLVIAGQSITDYRRNHEQMVRYLSTKYQKLMDDPDALVFALRSSPVTSAR